MFIIPFKKPPRAYQTGVAVTNKAAGIRPDRLALVRRIASMIFGTSLFFVVHL